MSANADRIVVVTGGSRGIGRAICTALSAPGTRVFFNYSSNPDAAKATAEAIEAAGGQADYRQVDVASESAVGDYLNAILKEAGRIDVLVNNAGVTRDGLLVRMKAADWDTVMDVNLKGTFHCMKVAAKAMMKQRYGRIVNISSVVGVSGNPGQANYVASKAGIIGLTKAVARELASRRGTGSRVQALCVSMIRELGGLEKLCSTWVDHIQAAAARRPGSRMVLQSMQAVVRLIQIAEAERKKTSQVRRPDVRTLSDEELHQESRELRRQARESAAQ